MEEFDRVPIDIQSINNPSLSPSSSSNGHTLTISPGMTQNIMLPKLGLTRGLVPSLQHVTGQKFKSKSFATEKDLRIQELNIVTRSQVQMQGKVLPVQSGEGFQTELVAELGLCLSTLEQLGTKLQLLLKNIITAYLRFCQIVGDYSEVGATIMDFKNVRRDLRAYILGADAQILVHNLIKKQEMCPAFAFDYEVDEDEQMSRLYDLAMGMEPRIIVIDQDPAMKVAIPTVFKQARHRYFMWHIMCKDGEKVGPTLNKDEEFRNKLNSIVWTSSLEPPDFEKQWRELMEKYNLVEHNWFTTMFEARKHWIPAYFRDSFMGGLLRTTSRSESENYTYSRFTGPQSNLVEFMMNFDSALKSQRNTNAKLNSDNEGYNPDMKTPLGIEKHASIVYTITVFYQVQEEICASCFKCMVLSVREDGGMLHYDIMHGKNKRFTVVHNVNDHEAKYSCKMFEMVGLLCRHIFVVFRDLERIPLKYVVNRWTKDASLKATFEIDGVIYDQNGPKDEKKMLLNKVWSDIHCCMDLAGSNMEQLTAFSQVINEQKLLLLSGKEKLSPQHSRRTVIESYCGSTEISEINILLPKQARNKGNGKRIKSSKELAMEKQEGRKCNFCGVRGDHHDTRTCPLNPKIKDKQKGKKKA
ncbi:PREDICTED: protein FAR1-RELATED SEQUENCE 1-like [Ipomoea nil]|uniref:protein FAR1-RELATED SEQUENCE 1-like n=1 Tax=Ipomoea nil TaxID=35883 RepID=UPI000901C3A7|nr:PREDICTED: protein FAR1-RELATED SEQUENCE 1-like [Ipomoea nil]